jgi:predicted nucleotidyltransferase
VLFGSVARHDERPLGHANTSDVDLLLVVNACGDISVDQRLAIFRAIGSAYDLIVDAPREVQAMLATHDLAEGDPAFVANVARDGRVLFARGPLPPPLAHLAPVEHGA